MTKLNHARFAPKKGTPGRSNGSTWTHLANKLERFREDCRGTTAVEFALLALPFFVFMVAILETGYMFLLAIVIEGATADAARQIRTGEIQQSDAPIAQFRQVLCDNTYDLVPCGDLIIDVRNFSRFADAAPPPLAGNPQGATFAPGSSGDVVVVRVAFQWSFITPLLEYVLGDASGTTRTFISSAAFRNEPF